MGRPAVASVLDREVVRRIDESDNGVGEPGDALGLAARAQVALRYGCDAQLAPLDGLLIGEGA